MSQAPPIVTFRVSVMSKASPEAIYEVLSDPSTHLVWAGERARKKNFRLLTMEAPSRSATVGERFSSVGENGNGRFHDESTVVEAERATRFGFDTDSTLERKHGKAWRSLFATRYAIEPVDGGAVISFISEVRPQNYVPYWLKPGIRSLVRVGTQKLVRRNMENLANMAEAHQARTS